MPRTKSETERLKHIVTIEGTPRRQELPQDERVAKILERSKEKMSLRVPVAINEDQEQQKEWASEQQKTLKKKSVEEV